MLKRILSTIVGLGILTVVMIQNNQFIFNVAVAIISVIALWEFYNAVKKKGMKPISFIGYASVLILLGIGYIPKDILILFVMLLLPISLFIAFCVSIFTKVKFNIFDISLTLMGIIYITYLFSFICYTKTMPFGDYLIWFIFGGAWMTDTFAYLVGTAIGKHKFSVISPNKSIEGCIGGIVGCIGFYLLYTYFLNNNVEGIEINYILIGIVGLAGSIASQIGDFAASAIKRVCEIKDFSDIMPGHGGILDRFDSILLIAPLVYTCLTLSEVAII